MNYQQVCVKSPGDIKNSVMERSKTAQLGLLSVMHFTAVSPFDVEPLATSWTHRIRLPRRFPGPCLRAPLGPYPPASRTHRAAPVCGTVLPCLDAPSVKDLS